MGGCEDSRRLGSRTRMGLAVWERSGHGVTHTNVFPRLGIGADVTRQGLHGTAVMNNVLTNWGEGEGQSLTCGHFPSSPFLGVRKEQDMQPLLPGCGREACKGKPRLSLLTLHMSPPICHSIPCWAGPELEDLREFEASLVYISS